MKTTNVKWGEENERKLATKVNAREQFVVPTWIDIDFSSPATAPEIVVSTAPGILQLRLRLKGLPRQICKGFPRGLGAFCWCSLEAERVI